MGRSDAVNQRGWCEGEKITVGSEREEKKGTSDAEGKLERRRIVRQNGKWEEKSHK